MTEVTVPEVTVDHFKGLPRRIKVGAFTYRVFVTNSIDQPALLPHYDGLTDFNKYRIYLYEGLPLQRAINVVLHELLHAINWIYGVTDDSTEEIFVTNCSSGLVGVFIDNPRLVPWLAKSLRTMKRENSRD